MWVFKMYTAGIDALQAHSPEQDGPPRGVRCKIVLGLGADTDSPCGIYYSGLAC